MNVNENDLAYITTAPIDRAMHSAVVLVGARVEPGQSFTLPSLSGQVVTINDKLGPFWWVSSGVGVPLTLRRADGTPAIVRVDSIPLPDAWLRRIAGPDGAPPVALKESPAEA
jgi:hypothetical protein